MENTDRAAKALAWIESRLAAGQTVYLTTALQSSAISPKVVASWAEHGGFFRLDSTGSLYVRRGRKAWDCIATKTMVLVQITAR